MMGLCISRPLSGRRGQTLTDLSFAERIIQKYRRLGRHCLDLPSLVFVKTDIQTAHPAVSTKNLHVRMQLGLTGNTQAGILKIKTQLLRHETKILLEQNVMRNIGRVSMDFVRKETELLKKKTQTLLAQKIAQDFSVIKKTLEKQEKSYIPVQDTEQIPHEFRPESNVAFMNLVREKVHIPASKDAREVRANLYRMLYVFGKSYPSAAAGKRVKQTGHETIEEKAAEKIFPILKQREAEGGKRRTLSKESSGKNVQMLQKQIRKEQELEKTQNHLEILEKRLTVQETVIKELKETDVSRQELSKEQISGITREVLKKMERELRLEKLRRGW